ncbi:unnamed protein product [Parascedosporium putredinis]|uniref:Uncharacterized protein n=1 Tax=Parascedosporium putredinis TaxID=1442378 RepID=A0A9P1GUI4_9PEZI|nr:unnamed protein product [Parascedosporium putredinis]CAI7987889.1 unnamed protein product [Parascedosporium putredinis]
MSKSVQLTDRKPEDEANRNLIAASLAAAGLPEDTVQTPEQAKFVMPMLSNDAGATGTTGHALQKSPATVRERLGAEAAGKLNECRSEAGFNQDCNTPDAAAE